MGPRFLTVGVTITLGTVTFCDFLSNFTDTLFWHFLCHYYLYLWEIFKNLNCSFGLINSVNLVIFKFTISKLDSKDIKKLECSHILLNSSALKWYENGVYRISSIYYTWDRALPYLDIVFDLDPEIPKSNYFSIEAFPANWYLALRLKTFPIYYVPNSAPSC